MQLVKRKGPSKKINIEIIVPELYVLYFLHAVEKLQYQLPGTNNALNFSLYLPLEIMFPRADYITKTMVLPL